MASWTALSCLVLLSLTSATYCPPGSKYDYDTRCYQVFHTPVTFMDAERHCVSAGGHLTDIRNAFDNYHAASFDQLKIYERFWIGANKISSLNWTWTSNIPMTYTNWGHAEPNNSNSCVYMTSGDSSWRTSACDNQLSFMCAISSDCSVSGICPTLPTVDCPSGTLCTNGYTMYSHNCMCYKYYNETSTFPEARQSCANDGGMLAKIPSMDVNDFLTVLPGFDCGRGTCPFIGLSCTSITESSCSWVDGTPLGNFSNFFNGPMRSNFYISSNLKALGTGMWFSADDEGTYICQKESMMTTEPAKAVN